MFDIGVLTNTFLLDTGDDETFSSEQNWYNFKTTWGAFSGFYDKPRTVDDAIAAGWQQVSNDCSEGTR